MQFLENPDAATLKAHGGGAHGFLALGGHSVFASNRDPSLYSYGSKASSDRAVYVLIHSGGQHVGVLKYMDVVEALRPDAYITMCDEVLGDARPKRIATAIRRTTEWAAGCLAQQQERPSLSGTLAFGAVGGGGSEKERGAAAKALADKPVDGYALCGFGSGEDPATRPALIRAALAPLQHEARAVHISGLPTLDDILDAIAEGVDLFDFALPAGLAAGGYALSFPLSPPAPGGAEGGAAAAPGPDPAVGADDMKINLWSTAYRLDKGPLVPGCRCFACARHSRAYVHHLLNTHEMLADVLLDMHNHNHILAWFQAVREAIKEDRFDAYRAWWRSLRDAPLAPAASIPKKKRRTSPTSGAGGAAHAADGDGDDEAADDGGAQEPPAKAQKP